MNSSKYLNLVAVATLAALLFCIYRDTLIEKEGTVDLRNRIVGSRLQKDGILPYQYKWEKGDSIRYYDPSNFSAYKVSNITASPFFHTLLYPIADLPQRQISYLWLLIEYLSLLIIALLGYELAITRAQKILVVLASVLFLYTEAWKIHTGCGQFYIIIPLSAMLFYYCLHRQSKTINGIIAGIITVSLILIRPNTVVFFLPFLFLFINYNRRFLIAFFSTGILFMGFYFSNKQTRLFWTDYKDAIEESIIIHQKSDITKPFHNDAPAVKLDSWEGWNTEQIKKDSSSNNFNYYSEHGNVFVLYYHIFKQRIPVYLMNILSAISIILLLAIYYFRSKKQDILTLPNAAILGACLYMITDFLSPVWRHQYNTVPWIFPLIVAASVYKTSNKWWYIVLGAGLFLNIINSDILKMEHTIGEYMFLSTFILLVFTCTLKTSK